MTEKNIVGQKVKKEMPLSQVEKSLKMAEREGKRKDRACDMPDESGLKR